MRLHLGCGTKKLAGFVNVDINAAVVPDVVDDIRVLSSFPDGCADSVYACHVLEHVGRWEWKSVLATWIQKLKPGGVLRIAVPSFEAAVDWYLKTRRIEDVMGLVCGGQKNTHDFHYVIFDKAMLSQAFADLGMQDIREYDWRDTDHSSTDDYSQAYLPHMQKETGMLMSLNMQCTKP